jgi:hypothetical protein
MGCEKLRVNIWMLSPLERRGKDVGAAYVPIDVSWAIHSSIPLFNSRSNLLRPLPLLTFLHSCILADLFVPIIEQEPGCFFFCSRFCNRLETLIGLIEIRCPALRLTRVEKSITRRFYANPKEHLQRGKIPARLLRPLTPTIFLLLFRTLTFTSLSTVQHHSATVLTSHNTKTIQDSTGHRERSEALPLLALTTLPDLDVSGTLSRCMLRQFCMR